MWFVLKFFIAIVLTEALTELITKSELFNPLRKKLFELGHNNKFFNWAHKLLDCGYCFSVWSGVLVAILLFRDVGLSEWFIDPFLIGIFLHRLANLFHNFMDRVHGI
jgi:hypothetical protein